MDPLKIALRNSNPLFLLTPGRLLGLELDAVEMPGRWWLIAVKIYGNPKGTNGIYLKLVLLWGKKDMQFKQTC